MGIMGRPKIEIDWEEFDKLCFIQCTLSEIAGWFDCSEDTIERRVKEKYDCTFAERYVKRSSKGKISLRRKQFQTAEGGNPTMQIWLGKQYLDQKDKHENDNKGSINIQMSHPDPGETGEG
jgi:hypothetical protein